MIRQEGIVVAADGRRVWVEFGRQTACGHCEVNGSCGTGAIGKVLGRRANRILLENSLDVRVGDRVVVGVRENILLSAAAWAYVTPLGGILAGLAVSGILGAQGGWLGTEFTSIVFAGVGLVLGFGVARKLGQNKKGNDITPAMLIGKIPPVEGSAPVFWVPRA